MEKVLVSFALSIICFVTFAQGNQENTLGKGIRFEAEDKSSSIQFNTRVQMLYEGFYTHYSNNYIDRMCIRRARIKFNGYVFSPKLTYMVQIGLTNIDNGGGDIIQANNTANILRDAYIQWNFYKSFTLMAGQGKLPGNRERMISSQNLEFVDRSYLNNSFNLDRDIGIQIHHFFEAGNMLFREIFSVSQGEGRDIISKNNGGYDFTGRIEWLPMGAFTNGGDYFEADLKREPKPKLSIGLAFDANQKALRERGQIGDFLEKPTDLRTYFIDGIFKFRGHSILAEYINRIAPEGPIVEMDTVNNIVEKSYYTGKGFTIQYGYVFPSQYQVAGRITRVLPMNELVMKDNVPTLQIGEPVDKYTFSVSKYISGHTVKMQSDITYIPKEKIENNFLFRLQFEVGI